MDLKERFLKYVSYDTQSSEAVSYTHLKSAACPATGIVSSEMPAPDANQRCS